MQCTLFLVSNPTLSAGCHFIRLLPGSGKDCTQNRCTDQLCTLGGRVSINIVIEMTELEANRVGKRFSCEAAPLRSQTQKTTSSNKQYKMPGTTAVLMVLTSLVPDPVRRRHSICRRPGVLERALEELLFCTCLLRGAGRRKERLRSHFACSTGISSTITISMRPQ